jgi:ribokinase
VQSIGFSLGVNSTSSLGPIYTGKTLFSSETSSWVKEKHQNFIVPIRQHTNLAERDSQMTATFVGITNMDLYSQCSRLPRPGETIHGISLSRGIGGKGSNSCAQFAFLATEAESPFLLTSLGDDGFGDEITNHYKRANIRPDLLQRVHGPTGTAICFVLEAGESAIVIHPCTVTLNMVLANSETIRASRIVVTNFEIPVDVASETLKIGIEGGATTILNVAPMMSEVEDSIFRFVTIVVANEVEMKSLGTVEHLFELGVRVVVVTLGSRGAALYQRDLPVIPISAPVVQSADTTGAGDSFLGAFCYCIAKGLSYEQAAQFACQAASISVQTVGAQQSYARRNDTRLWSLPIASLL